MKLFNSKRMRLFCIDLAVCVAVYAGAAICGLAFHNIELEFANYAINAAVFISMIMAARVACNVYFNVWRYAGSKTYMHMVVADIIGGFAAFTVTYFIQNAFTGLWFSVAYVAMTDIATLSSRFLYQQLYRYKNQDSDLAPTHKIGVAIVGAGQIGALLAEELTYNVNSHYKPVCFIDTDKNKSGLKINGLPVFPGNEGIIEKLKELPIQEIFIALPKLTDKRLMEVHNFYARSGCKIKVYGMSMGEDHTAGKRVIKEVAIEDLLSRETKNINDKLAKDYYGGKVIIVTGGGGSIGSEICRQLAKLCPKKLIIFDIYENNAYSIQQELIRKYGDSLDLSVEIGSVRDRDRLEAVFAHYKPEIVFHAAAHKHVPLMEHSNCEAIKNNVVGTYNTADMAEKYDVAKFVLISTDKAVNPTNVMGASKRMCEMVIQCRTDSKTAFAAVRFGNVLGSNGSVIPLFKRQIAEGGPVTVTSKKMIRYFMTIPEASQLVMQAGAMAKRGELFVLDMGKPCKIIELAENMVRLSGLRPYIDIDIVEIGLRPGEKLYEELLIKTEGMKKTDNNLIFIETDTPLTREEVEEKLTALKAAVEAEKMNIASGAIREAMKRAVPTFKEPEEVNCEADKAKEMQDASASE